MNNQETYPIKQYRRYRIFDGVQQVLLSWIGYKEITWQPTTSIVMTENDQKYMNTIRAKYKEIKEKYEKKGIDTNNLEIIDPHLRNARLDQGRLDIQYGYYANDQEFTNQHEEENQDKDDSVEGCYKSRNSKEIRRKTTKKFRRAQIAKANQRRLRGANQRQPQKRGPKQAPHPELANDASKKPSKEIAPNLPKDAPLKQKSFSKINKNVQMNVEDSDLVVMKKDESEKHEIVSFNDEFVEVNEEKSSLDSLKVLLGMATIKSSFQRRGAGEVFYEVEFNVSDMPHPIILHEDYLKLVCSAKLASFLKSKVAR